MPNNRKTPARSKTNVVIAGDHPIARLGLARLVNQEPNLHVSAAVENGLQALEAIRSRKPGLVIVDISFEEGSGLQLIKNIKAKYKDVPMLVLSERDEMPCAELALEAGAIGYVMKQEPSEAIRTAVRRVLKGDIYLSDSMARRMLKRPWSPHGGDVQSSIHALTNRELKVFTLIGQGRRTLKIAKILRLSAKTVETHRSCIMKKLNLRSWHEVARIAFYWNRNTRGPSLAEHPDCSVVSPNQPFYRSAQQQLVK